MSILAYLLVVAIILLAAGLAVTAHSLRKLKENCSHFASALDVEAAIEDEKLQREWLGERIDKVEQKAGIALRYLGRDPDYGFPASPDAIDARSPEQIIAESFEHKDYEGAASQIKELLAPKARACSGGAPREPNLFAADFLHYMADGTADDICKQLSLTKPGKHAVVIDVKAEAE